MACEDGFLIVIEETAPGKRWRRHSRQHLAKKAAATTAPGPPDGGKGHRGLVVLLKHGGLISIKRWERSRKGLSGLVKGLHHSVRTHPDAFRGLHILRQ
ncbi:hypothetical protein AA23498_3187 [Acetobacter nitrogenifigens DSM 23921 = NBRC 105050]|uniref:Uncharacterized protein n=1 Tax=Acetobacter nitrogenifigens DSM 23921 = NBRC 105050 TaxID=1120919 RepID=A0A511X5K6_9PROT|nr:hypothetical protein AA23498_3187 [Acetobacter nitrogenifigens DSM 23921 = NBRC 105050]GEN58237.1 hypothetical protein ANI02nite_01210 [Acetobacter nitrogenifigens DSM 23921 = NBRC 105050]